MSEDLCSAEGGLLDCGLCKSRLLDPRTLSCLHLFCLKCLQAYASSKEPGDQMTCPVCHSCFHVPDKGITELQTNGFVEKLLEAEKNARASQNCTRKLCDSCSEGTSTDIGQAARIDSAKWYCLPCKKNLCSSCCTSHTNSEPNRAHHLVESSTQHEQQSSTRQPSFCSTHQDREITLYCRDCNVAICGKCFTEQHSGHTCTDVEIAAEEFRQRIQQDIEAVKSHLRMGQDRMRVLEMQRRRLEDLDEIERIINQKSEELKAIVDNDTNRLLMSLEEVKRRATDDPSDRLSTETNGEGGSLLDGQVLEGLHVFGLDEAFIPINLTFTASQIGADDRNLIGRLVTIETSETLPSDDTEEKKVEINTDSGLHDEETDADG